MSPDSLVRHADYTSKWIVPDSEPSAKREKNWVIRTHFKNNTFEQPWRSGPSSKLSARPTIANRPACRKTIPSTSDAPLQVAYAAIR